AGSWPIGILRHDAVDAALGKALASRYTRQRSKAAIDEPTDRAATADSAISPGIRIIVELRRGARRVCTNVQPGPPHRANAIASVASNRARSDLGLGVPVHDHAMAAVVPNRIRESL